MSTENKSLSTFLSEWGGQVKAMIENSGGSGAINFIEGTVNYLGGARTSDYIWQHLRVTNLHSANPNDYIVVQLDIAYYFRITNASAYVYSSIDDYNNKRTANRIIDYIVHSDSEINSDVLDSSKLNYFATGSGGFNDSQYKIVFAASLLPLSSEEAFVIQYSSYDD